MKQVFILTCVALVIVGLVILPKSTKNACRANVGLQDISYGHLPEAEDRPMREYLELLVRIRATEAGINPDKAVAIAKCESTFNPTAKNPTSTAKGLFQFTDRTWKWIGAEGHQFDYEENINQFIKWYKKYPSWWECN